MARSDANLETLPDYAVLKGQAAPSKPKVIQLLLEGHQLRKTIAEAGERLAEIKSALTQIQLVNEFPGLRHGQYCFIAVERAGRATLSKERLIDNGVDPRIIAESTIRGDSYVQCELQVIGEKGAKKASWA